MDQNQHILELEKRITSLEDQLAALENQLDIKFMTTDELSACTIISAPPAHTGTSRVPTTPQTLLDTSQSVKFQEESALDLSLYKREDQSHVQITLTSDVSIVETETHPLLHTFPLLTEGDSSSFSPVEDLQKEPSKDLSEDPSAVKETNERSESIVEEDSEIPKGTEDQVEEPDDLVTADITKTPAPPVTHDDRAPRKIRVRDPCHQEKETSKRPKRSTKTFKRTDDIHYTELNIPFKKRGPESLRPKPTSTIRLITSQEAQVGDSTNQKRQLRSATHKDETMTPVSSSDTTPKVPEATTKTALDISVFLRGPKKGQQRNKEEVRRFLKNEKYKAKLKARAAAEKSKGKTPAKKPDAPKMTSDPPVTIKELEEAMDKKDISQRGVILEMFREMMATFLASKQPVRSTETGQSSSAMVPPGLGSHETPQTDSTTSRRLQEQEENKN